MDWELVSGHADSLIVVYFIIYPRLFVRDCITGWKVPNLRKTCSDPRSRLITRMLASPRGLTNDTATVPLMTPGVNPTERRPRVRGALRLLERFVQWDILGASQRPCPRTRASGAVEAFMRWKTPNNIPFRSRILNLTNSISLKNMMPEDLAIVVILGLRSTGEILAQSANGGDAVSGGDVRLPMLSASATSLRTNHRVRVVECYYPAGTMHHFLFPRSRRQATLRKIERAVEQELKKIGAHHQDVAGILFVSSNNHGKPPAFPFQNDTRFLEFKGPELFRKLLIVQPSPETSSQRDWSELMNAGMRVTSFEGTVDSARSVVRLLFSQPDPVLELQRAPTDSISPSSTATSSTFDKFHRGFSQAAPVLELQRAPTDSTSRSSTPTSSTFDKSHRGSKYGPMAQAAYEAEAFSAGRHAQQAVILLVGHSGHGKSKTINRLIGQDLLPVGKSTLGSTTKVIQRVKVLAYSSETAVTVTVAFDDTPGLEDTTYDDREANASLMRRYKQQYFPSGAYQTYPNVILLVASWDSITPDAHNEPHHFTSAAGKSMYTLSLSGLVDRDRANVVVVITKSLSSWDQFDDFESVAEKNTQWTIEAGRRRGIISELQQKVFPKLAPWPTVFVENGGGRDMRIKFPTLPSGELSHQNLFEAIRSVIEHSGPDGASDLAGMHALHVLTGAEPLDLRTQPETEILVSKSQDPVITVSLSSQLSGAAVNFVQDWERSLLNPPPPPPERRIQELADSYLGAAYDAIRGTFGRTRVLSLDPSAIKFSKGGDAQNNEFEVVTQQTTVLPQHCHIAGLSAHYSSSSAFQSALSTKSTRLLSRHVLEKVAVDPARYPPSPEMLHQIERLPRWSDESTQEYHEFFVNYGTHFVKQLAIGGVLRVIVDSTDKTSQQHNSTGNGTSLVGTSRRSTQTHNVMIFRDGGGSVASELTRVLESHFARGESPSDLQSIHIQWINALKRDPVFCPDDPFTEYEFLYNLHGLTADQYTDLKQASEFYLAPQYDEKLEGIPPQQMPPAPKALSRDENHGKVHRSFVEKFKKAVAKVGPALTKVGPALTKVGPALTWFHANIRDANIRDANIRDANNCEPSRPSSPRVSDLERDRRQPGASPDGNLKPTQMLRPLAQPLSVKRIKDSIFRPSLGRGAAFAPLRREEGRGYPSRVWSHFVERSASASRSKCWDWASAAKVHPVERVVAPDADQLAQGLVNVGNGERRPPLGVSYLGLVASGQTPRAVVEPWEFQVDDEEWVAGRAAEKEALKVDGEGHAAFEKGKEEF
ncbi:hypothetical protein B0H17DRAFT_1266588 [Mycena rosella]|uniref:MACPF domain-containing protein n=1 Tax=Mycena rosella TaxID=1033263 RepID=A0AAD7CNE0_MYCRO|nr:hypothetical protein B0H17DRAFT_1266588 [Mycena rosella]